MGQSAEELRREIDQTRRDMSGTVDAIGDRVSPGRIIERRTNKVRQGVRNVRESVMGPASDAKGRVGDGMSGAMSSVSDAAGTAGGVGDRRRNP